MMARAFIIWLLLVAAAVLNGALRQKLLIPWLGGRTAQIVSPVGLSVVIFIVTWVVSPWLRVKSASDAWKTGAFWLVLTLAFEFLAGHYLFHSPWAMLLAEYNITAGRLWILVLVSTLLAPPMAFRLEHARP
jgi:hypothetical protein